MWSQRFRGNHLNMRIIFLMLHINVKWWRLQIINEMRGCDSTRQTLWLAVIICMTWKLRSFRRLRGGKRSFSKSQRGDCCVTASNDVWLALLFRYFFLCTLWFDWLPRFLFFFPLLALHLFCFFTKVYSFCFNFTSLLFCVFTCFLLLFLPFFYLLF